jgi:GMP synthase-like glutamine amidotransferase
VRLAGSHLYENQAFRFSKNAYGFQFHIEVTRDMIACWFKDLPDVKKMIGETEQIYDEYKGRAMNFYKAFFGNSDD